jgi:hypothetical protein
VIEFPRKLIVQEVGNQEIGLICKESDSKFTAIQISVFLFEKQCSMTEQCCDSWCKVGFVNGRRACIRSVHVEFRISICKLCKIRNQNSTVEPE